MSSLQFKILTLYILVTYAMYDDSEFHISYLYRLTTITTSMSEWLCFQECYIINTIVLNNTSGFVLIN